MRAAILFMCLYRKKCEKAKFGAVAVNLLHFCYHFHGQCSILQIYAVAAAVDIERAEVLCILLRRDTHGYESNGESREKAAIMMFHIVKVGRPVVSCLLNEGSQMPQPAYACLHGVLLID
jgi:hypothetical protein